MILLRARITFDPDFGQHSRIVKRITRAAYRAGAEFWHREHLPRHFEPEASGRYGYQPRSPKYRRSRGKRGKPALVKSGLTRDRATATAQIKAYPSRVRITLYTPSYIPQRRRRVNMPPMADEIFRIRADEQKQIDAVMQAKTEQELRTMKQKRTVTIG